MHGGNNLVDKNTTVNNDIDIIVHKEAEDNDVLPTKIKKNFVISDEDILHNFINITLELREVVKCPLCLNVMNTPVEISCSHCFCEECLDTFLEEFPNKPLCPVCRSVINKRSRKQNESLLGYINFINNVNKELKSRLDREVTELNNSVKIKEKLVTNNNTKMTRKTSAVSIATTSDIIPGTIQTPKKKNPKRKGRSSTRKPISKGKQTQAKSKTVQNCITNEHRNSIIVWLNDTKNKFDRISQTQQSLLSKSSQESFDMPSVSQVKMKRETPPQNLFLRRTMSLNDDINQVNHEQRVRCNSWPCDNDALYDYLANEECILLFLEESKRTAELRRKEEEFLDSIESELGMQKVEEMNTGSAHEELAENDASDQNKEEKIKTNPETSPKKKSYDLEMVEAYFEKNLSKITNNDVESQTQKKIDKPAVETKPLRDNNSNKQTSTLLEINENISNGIEDTDQIFEVSPQKVPLPRAHQELIIAMMCCARKIETLSNEARVIEKCQLLKKYIVSLQNVLSERQGGSLGPSELLDVSLLPKRVNTADAEVQTDPLLKSDVMIQIDTGNDNYFTSSAISCGPSNDNLINRLIRKYENEPIRIEEQNELEQSDDDAYKILSIEDIDNGSVSMKVNENGSISSSFDDIDYDTQELLQEHNKPVPQKSDLIENTDEQLNENDVKEKKKFKRIRTPSDSDSDAEAQDRKRNKYLREDISVRFESEFPGPVEDAQENFNFSDHVNYNVFVDKILQKYDKTHSSTELKKSASNHSNDIIEKCDKIIKQVEKQQISSSSTSRMPGINSNLNNFKSPVFTSDETFNDENILQAIDRDVIAKSKDLKTVTKQDKLSESLLSEKEKARDAEMDLDDSFNEEIALFEPEKKRSNINILQHFVVKPNKTQEMMESDEEIFSDTDFVENTPPGGLSVTIPDNRLNDNIYMQEDESLDVILPPPPEFQEELDDSRNMTNVTVTHEIDTDQDLVEITLTENMKIGSLTPDSFSPPHSQHSQAVKAMGTSTPISNKALSLKTLTISPIRHDQNPFEAAKSKGTSLTVIPNTQKVVDRKITSNQSKQQKSILNYMKSTSQENLMSIKKPCITCSRLGKDHMLAVSSMESKKLAIYTSTFGPNVTHVVVAVNEKNCVKDHTIKYVCGVAAGVWIVSFKWVQECIAQNKIVPEEPFEVNDVSGIDGPRQSRLTRAVNPLLKGFKIFAAPPFISTTPAEVENVIKLLGGKVVTRPDELLPKQGYICVIISEATATQDFDIYESWLEALKVITVDIEWLSRSVGQYKVLSLRPFALCSEDSLDNLGYPDEMVANMQLSSSQSTYSAALS